MKTYNTYYEQFKEECWESVRVSEKSNGKKWWDSNTIDDVVNDLPLVENKTGVKSSEYFILHHILCQLLIDYISEHPLDNEVYSYTIELDLLKGTWHNYLNELEQININIPDSDVDYNFSNFTSVEDKCIVESFDELNEKMYFYISDFIRRNRDKLDVKITSVLFSTIDLRESLINKKWMPTTDSSISMYSYDELVVCSM